MIDAHETNNQERYRLIGFGFGGFLLFVELLNVGLHKHKVSRIRKSKPTEKKEREAYFGEGLTEREPLIIDCHTIEENDHRLDAEEGNLSGPQLFDELLMDERAEGERMSPQSSVIASERAIGFLSETR
jgi:hypothetical protein